MIVPEFMHFYSGYSLSTVLSEHAITFFALLAAMFRIKASEMLDAIYVNNADETVIDQLHQKSMGSDALLRQAQILREVRNG